MLGRLHDPAKTDAVDHFCLRRPFSATARQENLERLARDESALLLIGGGISGTAIARDAAMRGISTALVERGDLGAGTSDRSSRLIYGGIRYPEYGRLKLVVEACRQRRVMRRIAPRLVRPLPFLCPLCRGQELAPWKLRLGLTMYDASDGGGAQPGRARDGSNSERCSYPADSRDPRDARRWAPASWGRGRVNGVAAQLGSTRDRSSSLGLRLSTGRDSKGAGRHSSRPGDVSPRARFPACRKTRAACGNRRVSNKSWRHEWVGSTSCLRRSLWEAAPVPRPSRTRSGAHLDNGCLARAFLHTLSARALPCVWFHSIINSRHGSKRQLVRSDLFQDRWTRFDLHRDRSLLLRHRNRACQAAG